jgi:prepilin-type N-terminal cleavage/methylation domain-containing protein
MSTSNNKRAGGFTLVEVMVASLLIAIAVTGVMGGIGAITRADSRAKDASLLQRLAGEKINDLLLLADPTEVGSQGDFGDRGYPDVTWSANITSTSITNLDQVTITASRGNESQSLTTQVYVPPTSVTTTTTTTGTGTGTGQ